MNAHPVITLVFLAATAIPATYSSADDATPESAVILPLSIRAGIGEAAEEIHQTAWPVLLKHRSGESTVSLLEVIKTLRSTGFGAAEKPESQSGRRFGGRGGGARGGATAGGQSAPTNPQETRERFDALDTDGNGVWEKDEINQYMQRQPAADDGKVTYQEFAAAWDALRAGRGQAGAAGRGGGLGQRDQRGHGGGGHGGGRRDVAVISDAAFVIALDLNRDRKIESDEFRDAIGADLTRTLNEIARRDRDADGQVTANEYLAAEKPGEGESAPPTRLPRSFARMDQDADGNVSLDEALRDAKTRMSHRVAVMAACLVLKEPRRQS